MQSETYKLVTAIFKKLQKKIQKCEHIVKELHDDKMPQRSAN